MLQGGSEEDLGRLTAGHANADAQLLGLRGGIYDFRLEQVLGLDQRLLRRAAGNGQGLAELGRRLDVVDAAAD